MNEHRCWRSSICSRHRCLSPEMSFSLRRHRLRLTAIATRSFAPTWPEAVTPTTNAFHDV